MITKRAPARLGPAWETAATASVEDWKLDGACTQYDPDMWFPDRGQPAGPAKRICAEFCDVREQCLAYAVGHRERLPGVWGGLAERERDALRATPRTPRPHHDRPAQRRSPKVRCDCGASWCTGTVAPSTRGEHRRRLAAQSREAA